MKFFQLPIGARFQFKGGTYTKTSPMMASRDSSANPEMFRRSTEVLPAEGNPVSETATPKIDPERIRRATQEHLQHNQELVSSLGKDLDEEKREALRQGLAKNHRWLMEALGL
jgi:flagellin-specific chaperone FliS